MQRSEGPAYPGRPVTGIPPEVSWMSDQSSSAARSNSALTFDPSATGEQCSRTESSTGKLGRSSLIQ